MARRAGVFLAVAAALAVLALAEEQHCTADTCSSKTEACKPSQPPVRVSAIPETELLGNKLEVLVSLPKNNNSDVTSRLLRSLAVQNIPFTVLPPGSALNSKVAKDLLATRKDSAENIVMILNGNDFIFAGEAREIIQKFLAAKTSILFGAQRQCEVLCEKKWPTVEEPLAPLYLDVNSVIGYASDLHHLLEGFGGGDARYNLTEMYLEKADSGIKVDINCDIFQNLKAMGDDVEDGYVSIDVTENESQKADPRMVNLVTNSKPCVVRGAGNVKLLNQIGNYVPLVWIPQDGCIECKEHNLCLDEKTPSASYPKIFIEYLVEVKSPFLDGALNALLNQTYPKDRLIIRFSIQKGPLSRVYEQHVANWTKLHASAYSSVTVNMVNTLRAIEVRQSAFKAFEASDASHIWLLNSLSYISEPKTLLTLANMNRHASAALVSRIGKLFSNFWGSATGDFASQCRDESDSCATYASQGECENNAKYMTATCPLSCNLCGSPGEVTDAGYKRAFDYGDIVSWDKLGVWNVPFAYGTLLLDRAASAHLVAELETAAKANPTLFSESNIFLIDMKLSWWLQQGDFGLYLNNRIFFGDLIDPTGFDITKLSPDMYLLENNARMWADQYLHPLYDQYHNMSFVKDSFDESKFCWDIYNFPLFNERFCDELVAQSERYGKWSNADKYGGLPNADERLSGGYEPVPTQDIHFRQEGMDFAQTWYHVLKMFVNPPVESVWPGYSIDGRQTLDFIVKYRPDGQPFLRPHHDASTFSLNVALNHIGVDFEGGGTRFLRQNCTVLTNKKGYALFHPGRLTHQHEGLYVTKGTRYILVSFVDQ